MIALHSLNAMRLDAVQICREHHIDDLTTSLPIKTMASENFLAISTDAIDSQIMIRHTI